MNEFLDTSRWLEIDVSLLVNQWYFFKKQFNSAKSHKVTCYLRLNWKLITLYSARMSIEAQDGAVVLIVKKRKTIKGKEILEFTRLAYASCRYALWKCEEGKGKKKNKNFLSIFFLSSLFHHPSSIILNSSFSLILTRNFFIFLTFKLAFSSWYVYFFLYL